MKKILYVCNTSGSLARFRLPLLKEAKKSGYEILGVCGEGANSSNYRSILEKNNINYHLIDSLEDNGLNIFVIIKQSIQLRKIIKTYNPYIVHSFAHRANLVAYLSLLFIKSIHFIPNITGAGRLFEENLTLVSHAKKKLVSIVYKLIGKKCSSVFFQNEDDLQEFASIMKVHNSKLLLTNGSGLDPDEIKLFLHKDKQSIRNELKNTFDIDFSKGIFLFPTRALYSKGVKEFYEAAKIFLEENQDFIFIHIGESVNSSEGLDKNSLDLMQQKNIYYLGFQNNLYDLMAISDVVILPSFYREGVPRTLIEALAFGKIIITTNQPGCKMTVNKNGFLIENKSAYEIYRAMVDSTKINKDDAKTASNNLFREKFHIKNITSEYLKYYSSL